MWCDSCGSELKIHPEVDWERRDHRTNRGSLQAVGLLIIVGSFFIPNPLSTYVLVIGLMVLVVGFRV